MIDKPNVKRQCAVKKLPIFGNDFTNGWKQYYHHLVNNAILCHSSLIIAGTIKRSIFGLCFLVSQMIVMSCS